jgi:hypothetical protein
VPDVATAQRAFAAKSADASGGWADRQRFGRHLAGGQAVRARLVGVKGWLESNEKAVMMVLFLIIGAMLIGRGIRDLAGA